MEHFKTVAGHILILGRQGRPKVVGRGDKPHGCRENADGKLEVQANVGIHAFCSQTARPRRAYPGVGLGM